MKQKRLLRIMSFVLAFIMLLEIGPIHVFAMEKPPEEETPNIPQPEITAPEPATEMPVVYIEGEVQELRNEYEKHYRLTDGSFMAVQYQVPVHYEDDGQWVDIDNTLEPVTMFSGDTVYQAVNGENVQAFAADLSDGTIMTMANSDHMISMSIWTYDSTENAAEETESTAMEETVVGESTEIIEEESVAVEMVETTEESFPEDSIHVDAEEFVTKSEVEAIEESISANEPVDDIALVEGEEDGVSVLAESESEVILEDASEESRQNGTIMAQILTEDVADEPDVDTEEPEHWELDDVMPDALSSSILYEDVFPGVDLRYDTFSYNVKESIILKQPMDLGEYAYSFLLTLDGLEPELQEDGSILLLGEAYEVQYTIPAPYMWDSEDVYSDAVFYELEETDDGWVLTVCADESWLEDEERAYPVTIDPSVNLTTNIRYTTSVQTDTPKSNSDAARPGRMSCGYSSDFGQMVGYAQIPTLPTLPIGSTVIAAKFKPISASHWLDTNCRMDIYMLKTQVADEYWNGIVPWSQQPESEEEDVAMDFIVASQKTNVNISPSSWDITPAFMQWMKKPETNFGLKTVGIPTKSNTNAFIRFDKAQSYITVTYRNTVGTESYYTYETQSAIRAGTGYVSDFASALTVFKTDISYSSATIPFSVSHVYNSSLSGKEISAYRENEGVLAPDYSKMKTGNGWQLSVQESVVQKYINGDNRQVYRDGDGTLHYFNWVQQSTYVDEDGLGLTLRQYADGGDKDRSYEIKDQQGNIRFFRNNVISYIADANGNRIYFLYNDAEYSASSTAWHPKTSTSSRLTKIIAVNKEQTESLICKFTYVDDRLSSITDYAGRVTKYTYDSAGNLTKVTHPDNTEARYTYDAATGHLTGMYDAEAQYGIEYTYDSNGVATIQEYAVNEVGAKVVGTELEREKPSIQETVYRYNGNDRIFHTDDDIVNRYAFDYAGRTINAVTLDSNEDRILGVSAAAYKASSSDSPAANNRISKTGQSGQNGVNLLKNSGMEYANGTPDNPDWESVTTQKVNYTGEISTDNVRTGLKALKSTIKTSASNNHSRGRVGGMYQNVELEANTTYTFSAYVNTNGVDDFSDGSVYAAFLTANNGIIVSGNKITYKTVEEIDGGWQRIYCTYTTGSSPVTGRVGVIQEDVVGTVYYDDLQLEVGDAPSSANLLQNATFNQGITHWSGENFTPVDNSEDEFHPNVLSVDGSSSAYLKASQQIQIEQVCTDQTFLLSGWGKAASAADCKTEFSWTKNVDINDEHGERYYGLIAKCRYTKDGSKYTDYHYMPFNDDYDGWQFASCVIVPKSDYQEKGMMLNYIEVYIVYDKNFNTMWVDNLSLRQEPCTTYTYNKDGNVVGAAATGTESQSVEYMSDNIRPKKVWKSDSEVYYYQYNESNKYLPTIVRNDSSKVYTKYTYDGYGNVKKTEIGKLNSSNEITSYPKLISTADYSSDGSQLVEETNANGQTTLYTYNNYRDLVQTTDANGTNVVSLENVLNDRPKSSYISGEIFVGYSYDRGLLSRINRGGYITGNTDPQNQYYNMTYDDFGNMAKISIGGDGETAADTIVLADYDYGSYNNHLDSMTYGNGDSITYSYDELDRLTEEEWNDGTAYQYDYNSEGALTKKVDTNTGNTVNYEYDSIGRLIHSSLSDEDGTVLRTEHMYDRQNRIKEQSWQIGNRVYTDTYNYRGSDGAIESQLTSIGNNLSWAYDDIARVKEQSNGVFDVGYSYRNLPNNQTTTQISRVSYTGADNSLVEFTLDYTYDALGNITSVTGSSNSPFSDAAYEYDIQGQLTKETLATDVRNYEYDTYGNIRKAVKNGVTYNYSYDDPDWKDLLTAYDGHTITYDEIGNPLSYYNGTRWTFDWAKGRQLVSANSSGRDIEYTYDMAGIRDSKTVDGITYHYYTLSGKLMRQTWEDANGTEHVIDFCYDAAGRPFSMKYDGQILYYMLNQQGDVIRLVNSEGVSCGIYQYDAWGNILYSTNNKWLNDNPLRYRGYIYDAETGFYYLQSRYYDPTIGRFINADSFASTGQGFLGYNMFAYCGNDPANQTDPTGHAYFGSNTVAISDCKSGFSPGYADLVLLEQQRKEKWSKYREMATNEDPEAVLNGGFVSSYKGVMVIHLPFEWTAFSLGVIVLGSQYVCDEYGIATLNHEFGHYQQLKEYGWSSYISTVAVPSVTCNLLDCAGLLPWTYYSSPWEYEADQMGGVTRSNYASWAGTISAIYSHYSYAVGIINH